MGYPCFLWGIKTIGNLEDIKYKLVIGGEKKELWQAPVSSDPLIPSPDRSYGWPRQVRRPIGFAIWEFTPQKRLHHYFSELRQHEQPYAQSYKITYKDSYIVYFGRN